MGDKSCWSCGHFLIGGGCWKDGQMGEEGWKHVSPNSLCNSWVEEGTKGTITHKINMGLEVEIVECVMCNKKVDLSNNDTYEYDNEGEVWCKVCFDRESDTGEIS